MMIHNKPYSIEVLSEYVANDPVQVKEMIQLFLETIPPEIVTLHRLYKEEKWFEVYKLAHRIKPSFEVFSMDSILEYIKNIEIVTRENNTDEKLAGYIQSLSIELKEVEKMLKAELIEE